MKKKMLLMGALGLGVVLFAGSMFYLGRESVGNRKETNASEVSEVEEDTIDTKGNNKEGSKEILKKASSGENVTVSYKNGNSWESDGSTYTQYDVTISNHAKEEVSGWKTELTVPAGSKLNQGWNAKYSCKDSKLTAKPMDYNASIPAGGSINYGFILITKKSFTPKQTILTIDGQSTSVGGSGETVSNNDSDSDETSAPEKTEPVSTKKPAATKKPSATVKPVTKAVKESNPVKKHGRLTVKGTKILDCHNKPYQLKGVSTHGIAWFPQYVNEKSFKTLRDKYHVNAIRLAMYTNPGDGYTSSIHATVKKGVSIATKLGMYVIIDWHILNDNNPNMYKKEAKSFFTKMAKAYKGQKNVLYEICNEPNGDVTWTRDIKPYAKSMIKTIRKYDKKGIVIVGTSTWSQDVDQAAQSPITGQKNIVYTCHFYAATHKDDLRNKVKTALKKIPVFISEYSICDCSGNGGIDYSSARKWFSLIKKYKLSCCAWNLSNKAETSSLIKSNCNKTSGWKTSQLSKTGKWIFKQYGTY